MQAFPACTNSQSPTRLTRHATGHPSLLTTLHICQAVNARSLHSTHPGPETSRAVYGCYKISREGQKNCQKTLITAYSTSRGLLSLPVSTTNDFSCVRHGICNMHSYPNSAVQYGTVLYGPCESGMARPRKRSGVMEVSAQVCWQIH
jgi:hypothetical protein